MATTNIYYLISDFNFPLITKLFFVGSENIIDNSYIYSYKSFPYSWQTKFIGYKYYIISDYQTSFIRIAKLINEKLMRNKLEFSVLKLYSGHI